MNAIVYENGDRRLVIHHKDGKATGFSMHWTPNIAPHHSSCVRLIPQAMKWVRGA